MILRRLANAVRAQNWFTVALEIMIVVIGIFIGMQVTEWNQDREARARTQLVIQALREDLRLSPDHESRFAEEVRDGVAAWNAAFNRGERPPPYYFRIPGSDTAPANVWDAILNMKLGELVHPQLVFELAFYYSEREGVSRKYIRYVTFMEERILPLLKGNPSGFYLEDGSRLKPEYEVYMDNLLLWATEMHINGAWAKCLADKLETFAVAGGRCAPEMVTSDNGQLVFEERETP